MLSSIPLKYIILILFSCILLGILHANAKPSFKIPTTLLSKKEDSIIIDNNTFKLHSNKWKVTNPSFIKTKDGYIYSIRLIFEDFHNTGNESFLILGKKYGNKISWSNPIKTANKNSYFNTFKGIEDIRLFSLSNDKIYFIGTSLQERGVEGIPQIVLGNLSLNDSDDKDVKIIHLKSPIDPPIPEKNWLPLQLNQNYLSFVYRWEREKLGNNLWKLNPILGISDLKTGKTKIKNKSKLEKIPYFRGSTIPVFTQQSRPKSILADSTALVSSNIDNLERWVCLIHEITPINNSRIYCQRWVEFDRNLNVTFVSKPFTLTSFGQGIEFPMSMYPINNEWIISFGKDDAYAYLNYKFT